MTIAVNFPLWQWEGTNLKNTRASKLKSWYFSGFFLPIAALFGLKLITLKLKICCAVLPKAPSFNPMRFKEHFESILSHLTRSRKNKNIIIMGDFNIILLTCESHPESNDFVFIINSYFFSSIYSTITLYNWKICKPDSYYFCKYFFYECY